MTRLIVLAAAVFSIACSREQPEPPESLKDNACNWTTWQPDGSSLSCSTEESCTVCFQTYLAHHNIQCRTFNPKECPQ